MRLDEFYHGTVLTEASERLQDVRIGETKEDRKLVTRLAGPEVLEDSLVSNWLAFNYLFFTGFDHNNNLIMGEVGGTLPRDIDSHYALCISDPSCQKLIYGIGEVQRSRKKGDPKIITALEEKIEMPILTRGNVTVVQATRNRAHYDFTSSAGVERVEELLTPGIYELLSAEGFTVLSNKKMPGHHYSLNIPKNEVVFSALKGIPNEEATLRIAALKSIRDGIIPDDFLVGFHYIYQGNTVTVHPLVSAKDSSLALPSGLSSSPSGINLIGFSDSYGRAIGKMTLEI